MAALSAEETRYFKALDDIASNKISSHPLIDFWRNVDNSPFFIFSSFSPSFFEKLGMKNHAHSRDFDYIREFLKNNISPWLLFEAAKHTTDSTVSLKLSEFVRAYNHAMNGTFPPRKDWHGSMMLGNTFDLHDKFKPRPDDEDEEETPNPLFPKSLGSHELPKRDRCPRCRDPYAYQDSFKSTDSVFPSIADPFFHAPLVCHRDELVEQARSHIAQLSATLSALGVDVVYGDTDSVTVSLPKSFKNPEPPVFSDRITKVLDKHDVSAEDRAFLFSIGLCEDTLRVLTEKDFVGINVPTLRLRVLCRDLVRLERPNIEMPEVWL
jgi:hypothetical protein